MTFADNGKRVAVNYLWVLNWLGFVYIKLAQCAGNCKQYKTITQLTQTMKTHLLLLLFLAVLLVQLAGQLVAGQNLPQQIDPNCMCCGSNVPTGRYCGTALNKLCPGNKCTPNGIYYCYITFPTSYKVNYCPGQTFGHGGCKQVAVGSARCDDD